MINQNKILKNVDFRKSLEYTKEVKAIVHSKFNEAKKKLIFDFKSHPITVEIGAGPQSSNISKTLGGVGNLYSFIGFESGSDPIKPITSALNSIKLTSVLIKRDGTSQSYVLYPSAEDIFKITPLPWAEGRSWAKAMETGLSGLGYYLNKESEYSRSGEGIQLDSKHKIRNGKFQNTKYISSLILDFEKEINSFKYLKIQ